MASASGVWLQHSSAVASALGLLGGSLRQNKVLAGPGLPQVSVEDAYPGAVNLPPDDSTFPDVAAVYGDGSLIAGPLGSRWGATRK